MPHDKNGRGVQPGDRMVVEFIVREVHLGEEYCNLSLETVELMFPGEHKTQLTINARQGTVVA